jgi:hypothetical protein
MENEQKYELRFELRPEYLFAELNCDSMSFELARLYIQEVSDKCRETRMLHVIIDRNCPTTLSNAMSYHAFTTFSEMAPPGFRMAIVDAHEDNRKHLDFGTRSLEEFDVEVRIFATIKEAEAWLATQSICH